MREWGYYFCLRFRCHFFSLPYWKIGGLNFFFFNFGLKGVIEKCVGCFLVYLFWGFYLFCKRYYGNRGLNFCVKLIPWAANTLLAPKNELVCVLPFIGKKLSQLRFKLFKSVRNNWSFCYLKVVFQSPYKLHTLFRLKISLITKFVLILFILICVVTAMLLIMVKLTNTFLQELQNIWVFQI